MTSRNNFRPIRNLLRHADLNSGHSSIQSTTMHQVTQQLRVIQPFKEAWQNTIPRPASLHIQPVAYRDHKLTVWVSSPVWANWVRHRHNSLISSFSELKLPFVQHITIRVAPSAKNYMPISNSNRIRPRPSIESIKLIEKTAQKVLDNDLRESLQRLTRTLNKHDQ